MFYFFLVRDGNLSYYQISYIWYAAYAVLCATVVGVLVSLVTGQFLEEWGEWVSQNDVLLLSTISVCA